jgi:hypothetical protein
MDRGRTALKLQSSVASQHYPESPKPSYFCGAN